MDSPASFTKLWLDIVGPLKKETLSKKLFFGHVSTHGLTVNNQVAVLLNSTKWPNYFSMENKMRTLSGVENTYVISVFDCCRQELPPVNDSNIK